MSRALPFFFLLPLIAGAQVSVDVVQWQTVAIPTKQPTGITVHPDDPDRLYLHSNDGLFVSANRGRSWARLVNGMVHRNGLAFDPRNRSTVYVAGQGTIYRSDDRGDSWRMLTDFSGWVSSVMVTRDGTVFVGPRNTKQFNGVYKSSDRGQTWSPVNYNYNFTDIIPWDMEEDPATGSLWIGAEIGNHPQPYRPPTFRSKDGGQTWPEVGANLVPWHVQKIVPVPQTGWVYLLQEGPGLLRTKDDGKTFEYLNNQLAFDLLVHPQKTSWFFGTGVNQYGAPGGIMFSADEGRTFASLGPSGKQCYVEMDRTGTTLWAPCTDGLLYVADLTAPWKLNGTSMAVSTGEDASIGCSGCLMLDAPVLTVNGTVMQIARKADAIVFRPPVSLAPGRYPAQLRIGSQVQSFEIEVSAVQTARLDAMTSVLYKTKATYAPGEMVFLFGLRLTGLRSSALNTDNVANAPFPNVLGRTRVLVDDKQVPLQLAWTDVATQASQVNFQMPFDLTAGPHKLVVERLDANGVVETRTAVMNFTGAPVSTVWFGNEQVPIFLQNMTQDPTGNTLVTADKPARPGDVITVYGTGLGAVSPSLTAGTVPTQLARVTAAVSSTIRNDSNPQSPSINAVNYGAVANPQYPGLYQFTFVIPTQATPDASGNVYLLLSQTGTAVQTFAVPVRR
jgi:uncharacterized protein (TIGR03437 family)